MAEIIVFVRHGVVTEVITTASSKVAVVDMDVQDSMIEPIEVRGHKANVSVFRAFADPEVEDIMEDIEDQVERIHSQEPA